MGSPPDASVAFTAGLTFDMSALITRPVTRLAAAKEVQKTDLNLLWQELQVISQARMLFIKQTTQDRTFAALDKTRALFQDRLDRTRTAAQRGLLANDSVTPHLTALQDVIRQLNDLERARNQTRHDLNALLGLAPEATLLLVGPAELPAIDARQASGGLRDLPARRPDLLALQAGYGAEDDRYRGALLAQFPALTIGPTRARDTTYTNNRRLLARHHAAAVQPQPRNIAIEKATRERLRVEYQGRLDASVGEIEPTAERAAHRGATTRGRRARAGRTAGCGRSRRHRLHGAQRGCAGADQRTDRAVEQADRANRAAGSAAGAMPF